MTAKAYLGEARRASHALTVISGPMPAGSPMLSANGRMWLGLSDDESRFTAQITQGAL